MNSTLSRRAFVKTSIVAATALGIKPVLWAQGAAQPRISVQLYSVRDDCAKDFDAALAQLAKMGFAGVEFAGYHNYSGKAKELRQKLDDLNLVAAGTHIGTGSFRGDELKRTIEFHQCARLQIPDRSRRQGFYGSREEQGAGGDLQPDRGALKPLGMFCGYHNHKTRIQEGRGQDLLGPVRRAHEQGRGPAAGLRLDRRRGPQPGGAGPALSWSHEDHAFQADGGE